MKRFLSFMVLGLFLISMMGGALALTPQEIGAGAAAAIGAFVKGLSGAIGADAKSGISKFFFVILLAMIIHSFISSFFSDSNTFLKWGITISISALAYLGIPEGYLEALLVSYGAMGLTILTVIPFLIMVIFTVKVKDLMIARGTWVFYVLYYMISIVGKIIETKGAEPAYWIAILGGGLMFFTIPYLRHMFDEGKISAKVEKAEAAIEKHSQSQKIRQKSDESVVENLGG